MQFTNLKLTGFKSFVDPTDFRIEPGVTGIVGPNGCGKSNLLEALRWVMGANSAKAMRAGAMDDVIFSGTGKRPARNHAEVVLTLDNSGRTAPDQFNDSDVLQLSRRIDRGSGSTYRINSRDVRAKDIQLLLADASTGANSPALVRQGQISELIAAKPQNRRRVLEEAAGISGLHTRRHEAELRLRAAETNLSRLEDIREEIEAQYAQVKRQVRAASRYKNLAREIRALESFAWVLRWNEARAQLETTTQELQELDRELADLSSVATRTLAASEAASDGMDELRKEQAIANALVARLESARETVERESEQAQLRIHALNERLEEIARDLSRESDLVTDAESAIARLQSEQADLQTVSTDTDTSETDALREQAEAARQLRDTREAELEALTMAQAEQQAVQTNARTAISVAQARVDRLNRELVQANERQADLFDGSVQEEQEFAQLQSAWVRAETKLAEKRSAVDAADTQFQQTEAAMHEARAGFDEARRERDKLHAEKTGLEKVLADEILGDWPSVAEQVQVEPGYERALAVALGDDLQASTDAQAPAHWQGAEIPEQSLPSGAQALSQFVQAPAELTARLVQVGLVDEDRGADLAGQLLPGQRLVSQEGHLWRWDGFAASADAPSTAARRLEQKNRLVDIVAQLANAEATAATARETWLAAKEKRAEHFDALKAQRRQLPELEHAFRAAEKEVSSTETANAQKAASRDSLAERIQHWQEELHAAETELAQATAQAESLPVKEVEARAREIETARQARHEARAAASEADGALRGVLREREARTARMRTIAVEIEQWQTRARASQARRDALDKRQDETRAELDAARSAPEQVEQRRLQVFAEVDQAENRLRQASDSLSEAESNQREARDAARQAESAAARAREARAALIAKREGAEARMGEIRDSVREALGCEPEELTGGVADLKRIPASAAEAEMRLHKLRRERDNIGGVNLQAEEQSEELRERLDSMQSDRDELEAAIAKLRTGVDILNREGRARLLTAFDTINNHFKSLFLTLFNGGEAELRLTESDDPLEAGLEIFASPPGKKLGSMMLMSGGEQALTAMSLVFAVFLSNPAPICVLDEVDAPLDDANVERFCNLLDEMCKRTLTRFITITHNPLTMSRTDRLYGVTMAERGVSSLVSMDLQRAEDLIAAE